MRRAVVGKAFVLLALALLVFGGLPHARCRKISESFNAGTLQLTPTELFEGLRSHLTDDGDIQRYRAYAQAALGRPYSSFYVRTQAEWYAHFAQGVAIDSDLAPEVRPAAPLRPYRDFLVEYPPAFFLLALAPALVSSDLDGYALVFKILMAICLALAVWCTASYTDLSGRSWLLWMGGAVLALGAVTTHRYDAAVALGLCSALWALKRNQTIIAGLCIGAAVALKGAPLLFIPPMLMYLFAERGLRAAVKLLLVSGAVVVASLVPTLVSSGWAFAESFAYHQARPVQIESTFGSLLALGGVIFRGSISVVYSFGSVNLAGRPVAAAGALTSCLMLLFILCSYAVTWHRIRMTSGMARRMVVMEGSILTGLAFMLFGKVFSPQYLTWILPFCVSAAVLRSRGMVQSLIALLALTQVIFPWAYGFVITLEPWASLLVVVRNVGLLVWAARLLPIGRDDACTESGGPGGWSEQSGPTWPCSSVSTSLG